MPEASNGLSPFRRDAPDTAPPYPAAVFRKTTAVDWPGRIAAALFLPGCGLRCPWCQNRELVLPAASGLLLPPGMRSLESALAHLEKRRAVLGGVVISGGEPTAHPALPALIAALHEQGFPVKLDTNGMNPRVLAALFRDARARPDYIALDLKVAPERYGELAPGKTGQSDAGKRLTESARLIAGTDIQREYRSLALPDGAFGAADIAALAPLAAGGPWVFRRFVPGNCLDPAWNARGAAAELPELFAAAARKLGANGIAQSYTSPQRAGH